jgi:uncharacterized protein (UPF0332 family)
MSFDWFEYFEIAQQLFTEASQPHAKFPEGKYRATISRAYYSTFITARNRLRDVDLIKSPRKDGKYGHTFVVEIYATHTDFTRHRIGLKLRLLMRNREKADYEDTLADVNKIAKQSLRLAEDILNLITML